MRILTAVIVATIALTLPLRAEPSDVQARCTANNLTPQERLESCTAAIEDAQKSPQDLAVAYYRRGSLYLGMRDQARAIAAFDQAVALDPN